MSYCITFKDLSANELKLQWKKQNHLLTLNYNYFVTKNPYHLIKDKSMPRNAIFAIKVGFKQLICTRVYYHQFLPNIAHKLAPPHRESSGRGKSPEWSLSCQEAFDCAKPFLDDATLLQDPRANAITSITVDASDVGLGVQLEQLHKDTRAPTVFFS